MRDPTLDAKTLATLCATGRENSAATLGCHTSTETMALGTLMLVWLISAFHSLCLSVFKQLSKYRTGVYAVNLEFCGKQRKA